LLETRPQVVSVTVGPEDHTRSHDASAIEIDAPARRSADDAVYMRLSADLAALPENGGRQSTCIPQRVDRAAARVEASTDIETRATTGLQLTARQELQGRATAHPDLHSSLQIGETRGRMGRGENARSPGTAF